MIRTEGVRWRATASDSPPLLIALWCREPRPAPVTFGRPFAFVFATEVLREAVMRHGSFESVGVGLVGWSVAGVKARTCVAMCY